MSLAAIAGILVWVAGCADPSGPTVRLVTWNVHACQGGVENIASELHKLNPDIVCLQEVQSGTLASPDSDEAERIADRLGMYHIHTPNPAKDSKEEQLAIFCRGKLEDAELLENGTGRRYGISAETELADGTDLHVVCVHFTSNSTKDIGRFLVTGIRRLQEASDLTRRASQWKGNFILAGDFNATPVMLEHTAIGTHMRWVNAIQPTYPSTGPILQLDHVFLKGSLQRAGIFAEPTRASDHWMLVADIHVPNKPGLAGKSGAALFESQDHDDRHGDDHHAHEAGHH